MFLKYTSKTRNFKIDVSNGDDTQYLETDSTVGGSAL